MVTRWPHRAEAAKIFFLDGQINGQKHAACRCGCRVPGAGARYRVAVETPATFGGDALHEGDIVRVMAERELGGGRVAALEVIDGLKEIGMIAQRAGDGAQSSNVLGMIPAGVVPAAIAVRYERRPNHVSLRRPPVRYWTGLRRRSAIRKIEPSVAPASARETLSSRISKPCSLTTNSRGSAAFG